jgi:hypothetical protein
LVFTAFVDLSFVSNVIDDAWGRNINMMNDVKKERTSKN